MKMHSLRTSLIVTLALTVTQVLVLAQNVPDNFAHARSVEGVWDVSGTARQCDTGDPIVTFRAMNMFIRGGTLTETGPNFLRSSSLGTWHHLGERSYMAVFTLHRFSADGSFAGRSKVTRNIELSKDAGEFTSTYSLDVFN